MNRWSSFRARIGGWLAAFCAFTLALPVSDSALAEDAVNEGGRPGVILPIRDTLTDITVESLKRRMEQAQRDGAAVIIFDMDTPGGLVTSSIAIADLIKNLSGVKTVAWVNPNAHSGGALVAVACNEIVMTRSSRLGDAQVIIGGLEGVTAVPEELQPKVYTPVLAEFRASARLNGYDQTLCEAFVIPDREVWWVEHIETGEREFVLRDEKIKRVGDAGGKSSIFEETPKTPEESPEEPKKWRLVKTYFDPVLGIEVDTIQPVDRDDQLLEMSASEAYAYGFSKGVIGKEDDLVSRYNLSRLLRIEPNWSEALAYWLTSLYVRGFLIVLFLLGTYVEFHTPGIGLAGLVALICLAVFVGAPYLTGLANVWEIVLILAGLIFLGLEFFVIPGFGVAGIFGAFSLLIGLLATFVPDEPGRTFPLFLPSMGSTIYALKMGIITLGTSLAASFVGMALIAKYLPKTQLLRALVPANPTPSQVQADDPYRGAAHVGDLGVTAGPLRPGGKARFGPMLVDVVTRGEYLDGQTQVEVVERRGNRVVVRTVS